MKREGKYIGLKKKYGFFDLPSAATLGVLDNLDSTYFYADKLATLLEEIGINVNYAPCLDLAVNPDNPVIAKLERSFSDSAEMVTKACKECDSGP